MADVDQLLHFIKPGWTGVEIGVSEGISAEALLRHGVEFLYLVDPWVSYQGVMVDDMTVLKCLTRVKPFIGHYAIYRMPSDYFYWKFRIPTFNFVWIDGDHTLEQVRKDVKHFYETIKPGGILCGHDYTDNETCQVKTAVDEFAAAKNLRVEVLPPCWMIKL